MSSGVELGLWVAGWFDEILSTSKRSVRQLMAVQDTADFLLGLDACTDCYSLYSTLRNADLVRPQDDSLLVYIAALRQELTIGKIRRTYWLNTWAMLADGLTKGSGPRDALVKVSSTGGWSIPGRSEVCVGKRAWETQDAVAKRTPPAQSR